jgi:Flp pilus assembly protein TadD
MTEVVVGDFPAAKRSFLQALRLAPHDAATRNNLTMVLVELGDFSEAEPHIERLIVEQPEDVSHCARLAWCQWKLGKREAAQVTLAHAASLAPNDPILRQVTDMILQDQSAGINRP